MGRDGYTATRMTHHIIHLDELNHDPAVRVGAHWRAALDEAGTLFSWLPFGTTLEQTTALVQATASQRRKDQTATHAWAQMVRGHALDFHADAGRSGTLWQHAVAEAWETWLMLRDQQVGPHAWPWQVSIAQFQARGTQADEEWMDPHAMQFGGGGDSWKRADMSDWRRGVARLTDEQACLDAQHLAREWPKADLSTLAMGVGAWWAIALPGWVMGAQRMEMGGARGRSCLVITDWN